MKSNLFKLSLSLLLILVASFSFGQNPTDFNFIKPTQKFKKVNEGHQVEFIYLFTYSGEKKLDILPPEVDCSCTQVTLPEGKIETGKTYSIIINFDTKSKIGYQERDVMIDFVNPLNNFTITKKLTFKGVVKASKATKEAYKKNKKKEK